MNQRLQTDTTNNDIEQEYREFLTKLDALKKEQEQLIREYREKLEQRKNLRLKEQTDLKE